MSLQGELLQYWTREKERDWSKEGEGERERERGGNHPWEQNFKLQEEEVPSANYEKLNVNQVLFLLLLGKDQKLTVVILVPVKQGAFYALRLLVSL